MARGSGFSGAVRRPTGPRGLRLPLPLALTTLFPPVSDIGDYTDRATSPHYSCIFSPPCYRDGGRFSLTPHEPINTLP
jgi:hypothetical protein